MHWLLLFLLMLTLPTPVLACRECDQDSFLRTVTLTDPASYKLIYTGFAGLILDEYVRLISKKWKDDLTNLISDGNISGSELRSRYRLIDGMQEDYNRGDYTDSRHYWWHYSSSRGRLPRYTTGPSSDVINIGPFRLNRKFKFKLRDYRTNITSNWAFRFRPSVNLIADVPFVQDVSAGFVFTYKERRSKLFMVTLSAGFSIKRNRGELMLLIELPMWGGRAKRAARHDYAYSTLYPYLDLQLDEVRLPNRSSR